MFCRAKHTLLTSLQKVKQKLVLWKITTWTLLVSFKVVQSILMAWLQNNSPPINWTHDMTQTMNFQMLNKYGHSNHARRGV